MPSAAADNAAFYRPRNPRESPLYRLLEEHYEEFERVYPERYQQHYGFWRPVIRKAVLDFFKCGDLREGFARVRCPDCRHEFFVAYSCKQRCVCPCCHQKRSLTTAQRIAEGVSAPVPHRQFVFTMPKRFRLYFRYNRELLRKLPPLAWETVRDVYPAVLGRDDVTPGLVLGIQTHGEIANWHPHLHVLATDGAFTPDGAFVPLPETPAEPYLKLWEKKLFDLLLAEGRITQQVIEQMRTWQHSGFSVDKSVRLAGGDTAAIERLTQYILRCPFSLDRIVSLNPDLSACGPACAERSAAGRHAQAGGKVVYRAEKPDCRPFPVPGDQNLRQGVKRNFEVFDPLDFIAEITQHIPDPGAQQIRYYGWYSNRSRGDRAKALAPATTPLPQPTDTEDNDPAWRKKCRMRWAALIKKVYEVDPLKCPACGAAMKIVAFIERRDQAHEIRRILTHCGLWDGPVARAPPAAPTSDQLVMELEYVDTDEFLAAL
ncbi:MAG: transposase [Acidobacteria bacterium]|nr:transposase [Acidobacteriota bacterium]